MLIWIFIKKIFRVGVEFECSSFDLLFVFIAFSLYMQCDVHNQDERGGNTML